jgi:hypothetical protein
MIRSAYLSKVILTNLFSFPKKKQRRLSALAVHVSTVLLVAVLFLMPDVDKQMNSITHGFNLLKKSK